MNKQTQYGLHAAALFNALGNSNQEILNNLLAGTAPGEYQDNTRLTSEEATTLFRVSAELPALPSGFERYECRNNRLLWATFQRLESEISTLKQRYSSERIGVVIGTSTSGISAGEDAREAYNADGEMPAGFDYIQQEIGSCAPLAAELLDIHGPAFTISTACSSSAKAFACAHNLISMELCDAVIVGGVDTLCRMTVNGFNALDSVSRQRCNPFSKNRCGINIGEASALFIMTREPADIVLSGVGESSDAYHISAPEPEGKGAERAIRAALEQAGLETQDISYVNLHGTATPHNDAMESRVIDRIMPHRPAASSTKSLTGHTLGAAGATEIGLCWLLLSQANSDYRLPPQVWDGEPDDSLPQLNLSTLNSTLPREGAVHCLSNSFAFGGSNAAVIISRTE